MGAYNILKINITCKNCDTLFMVNIQFKFGDTWQYEYFLGEKIKWEGADIGVPGFDKVKVYGICELDRCIACGYSLVREYDIIIEKDIIKYITPLISLDDYDSKDGET